MTLLKEKSEEFLPKKVYINRKKILELYKNKLLKFHSVSNDNFIYYLKELEFKYNVRDNIYDSLYNCLVD